MQHEWIRILVASIGGIVVAGLCIMLVEMVAASINSRGS